MRIVGEKETRELTRKNSPSVELYGLHGLPLMYFCSRLSEIASQIRQFAVKIYQVLSKPEPQNLQHPPQFVVRFANAVTSVSEEETRRF